MNAEEMEDALSRLPAPALPQGARKRFLARVAASRPPRRWDRFAMMAAAASALAVVLWLVMLDPVAGPAGAQDAPPADGLPPGAIRRLGDTRFRHDSQISGGVFSRDGSTLYTSSYDKTVRAWEVATGKQKMRLMGHTDWVLGHALSPDGRTLASGGKDGTIRLWDLDARSETAVLKGNEGPVRCVAFTKDAGLYSGGEDRLIRQWDLKSGKTVRTLEGHEDHILTLALSPDGSVLASGSKDTHIRLWNVATGACTKVLEGHEINVNAIAFSPDGARLASGSGWNWVPHHEKDLTVRMWDVASGGQIFQSGGFKGFVHFVSFLPDGRSIVAAAWDRSARVCEAPSLRDITPFKTPIDLCEAATLTPDGRTLVTFHYTARFWDLATGREINPPEGPTSGVTSIAWSPDGTRIATGGDDRTVHVWDAATGRAVLTIPPGHAATIACIRFSPDGRYVASSSADPRTPGQVMLWDARTGELVRRHSGVTARFLCFLKTHPVLVLGGTHGALWNYEQDRIVGQYPLFAGRVAYPLNAFCVLPDDKTVVFSNTAGEFAAFEAATGTRVATFIQAKDIPQSYFTFGVSPDGRLIVSSDEDNAVRFWDVAAGREIRKVDVPELSHREITFSPDGRWFASLMYDGRLPNAICVWETATAKEAFRIPTITVPSALAFSPDSRKVAAGGFDGTLILWDLAPWAYGAKKPDKPDAAALWKALLEKDGIEACAAVWGFPRESAAFLAGELTRTTSGSDRVKALVKKLDDADPDTRETAARELGDLGPDHEPALAEAAKEASAEAQERIRRILEGHLQPLPTSREIIRRIRAVHALELMGTKEAIAALETVARAAPVGRLHREAAAALKRLK